MARTPADNLHLLELSNGHLTYSEIVTFSTEDYTECVKFYINRLNEQKPVAPLNEVTTV